MNPTDILKYGHQTVTRTIESFPQEEWYTTGACGYWSVKDLIAHLGSFELMLEDLLNNLLKNTPTPTLDLYRNQHANFNDEQVNQRSKMTMEQVLAEYQNTFERVMVAAAQVSPEMWNREGLLPWYGTEYDLEDFIVYTFYGHKREHCGQIAVFSDRFK
jgi:uncharacterized damage-inducible protein DinB